MDNAKPSGEGNASALIVAIEDYKCHPKLDKLSASANDLANVLEHGGFLDAYPRGRDGKREAHELSSQLKNWFAEANSEQRLLLFWTGHGELESTRLYLMTQDSPASRFDHTNSVEPSFIAKQAALSKAKRILLVIDACHSGATIGSVIAEIANVINEQNPDVLEGRGVAVIASVHAIQKAQAGVVCRLLKEILIDTSLPRRWSDSDRFIDADRLTATLKDEVRRRGVEQQITSGTYSEVVELIPNPRYRDNLPAENVEERLWRLADAAEHFELAARGIEVDEKGWFFSGRKRLLRELVDWLNTAEHGVRIVTGPPGAGKSAVMGRLATLSDAQYRQEAIDAGVVKEGEDVIPPVGAIDVAVHAKGKTLDDCARALAKGLGVGIGQEASVDIERLVGNIAKLDRCVTLMIDALDEAATGQGATIALRLIVPLGSLPRVRILVGTRRSFDGAVVPEGEVRHGRLRAAFGADAIVDDLEDEPETQDDIAAYVRIRLKSSAKHRSNASKSLADVADRVAAQAQGIFLYARIVSRTLQDRDRLDGNLPATALEAFEQDLSARFEGNERRVDDLLGALAWGEGKGLTRRVWPLIANTLAGVERPYDDDDIAWVLGHAGWHIIEAGEDGQAVYRLAHQVLADYYHEKVDENTTQGRIVDALTKGIRGAGWLDLDKYLWRHLSDHAAKVGRLDDLIRDPGYLAVANPTRLVLALPRVESKDGRRFAYIYDRAVDRLINQSPVDRMPLIHMMAQMEDADIAPILEPPIPARWRCRWARVKRSTPHRVIGRHDRGVTSIAFGEIDGVPVIISGGLDNTIRRWDARTGEQIGKPIVGHDQIVQSVTLSRVDGVPIIFSEGLHGAFRQWDARTGEPIGEPFKGHKYPVNSVEFGVVAGAPFVVSGSDDIAVRLWNERTEEAIGQPPLGHDYEGPSVAFGLVDDTLVKVGGGSDGTLRRWDARTGEPIGEPLKGHSDPVNAVALGLIDGVPIIVSASGKESVFSDIGYISGGEDNSISRWDARTGQPIGNPLEGHVRSVVAVGFGMVDGAPIIISGSEDHTIRLWDARLDNSNVEPVEANAGPVSSVAFGVIDNSPVVISENRRTTIRCWDAHSGEPIGKPLTDCGQFLDFGTIDGVPVIISTGVSNSSLRLWNARTSEPHGEPFGVTSIANYISAGALGIVDRTPVIVTGHCNNAIYRWDVLSSAFNGSPIHDVYEAKGFANWISSKISNWFDKFLRIRKVQPNGMIGKPIDAAIGGGVRSIVFGSINEAPIIISGGWKLEEVNGGIVCRWDARTGKMIGKPLKAHHRGVSSVAFGVLDELPIILSGGGDGTIRCWNALTGKPVGEPLQAYAEDKLVDVAFGRVDGLPVIVSGGDDGTVRCWGARTGKFDGFLSIIIGESVKAIKTDDGSRIAIGLERGVLLLELLSMP